MTAYVANQTADYDGSSNEITATGPATVTYSGTVSGGLDPAVDVYVSAGGADPFVLTQTETNRGAFEISLRTNDKFYLNIRNVATGSDVSLHYNFGA